jgi:hypothetical protein
MELQYCELYRTRKRNPVLAFGCLLDRPVEPGDDSVVRVNRDGQRSKSFAPRPRYLPLASSDRICLTARSTFKSR